MSENDFFVVGRFKKEILIITAETKRLVFLEFGEIETKNYHLFFSQTKGRRRFSIANLLKNPKFRGIDATTRTQIMQGQEKKIKKKRSLSLRHFFFPSNSTLM